MTYMEMKMKMKKKKIISVILIIAIVIIPLILLTLLPLLTSCASKGDGLDSKDGEITSDNSGNDDMAEITGVETEAYKLPDINLESYEMRLVTISNEDWAITDLDVQEENGEPVNDAIYRRNRQVEEALNVVIKETPSGITPHEKLKKSVAAGLDEYDLMFAHATSGGPLASMGYYVNLKDISSLNLDQPYWDQGAVKSFELMNKLYFTTSDACLMTSESIWVLYFNKKIHQNLGIEDPYKLVREGKWTMDAMYNMMREAVNDLDGDGVFTAADQWGMSSWSLGFLNFLEGQGEQLVKKNSDGYPVLSDPDEKFIGAYAKIRNLMNKTNGMYLEAGALKGSQYDHATKTFMNEMTLFCAEVLGWSRKFREMTADFGILPHPKYDENQANHFNGTAHVVPIFAIPITNPNPERTGVFIDALTAMSATTITPAYYTISLEGKFTRDEDSIEMLDIIRSNRVYELAVVYNWSNFYSSFISHGTSPSGDNPVTVFEKQGDKVRAQIDKTIETFEGLN